MAGDYTRATFRPEQGHAAVLMQQGRVQVDADWNELVELLDRRLSVETIDILGRCRVPRETKDAFLITPVAGDLEIGVGRAYVDGILVHNRGTGTVSAEPAWDEPVGADPTLYSRQPFLLDPPWPSTSGRYLAYLDVWRREVTAVEDERLVDPAIGVDTTTRLQTAWQVRLLEIGGSLDCDADWDKVGPWQEATARSGARLTTRAIGTPATTDPCLIPPQGGYRGIDNRLYRVEIHDGTTPASPSTGATFKWSRSNVSVAARITGPIQDAGSAPKVPVDAIGRDAILRFTDGDAVEILDDVMELAGRPGIMARIKPNGVDAARNLLLLDAPLVGAIDLARNPRVRRWDQRAGVTNGVVPVTPGTPVELEDGVEIEFGAVAPGTFHTGDYWIFATRVADASVELLDAARPRGIRHHYCRLAILELGSGRADAGQRIDDCRDLWPPEGEKGSCDCDACLAAPAGDATEMLQRAIDELHGSGGKICLGPGTYRISRTLRVVGAVSLRITGKGWRTVVAHTGRGPAFHIERSANVTLEELTVAVVPGRVAPPQAVEEETGRVPRIVAVEEEELAVEMPLDVRAEDEMRTSRSAATSRYETGTDDLISTDAAPAELERPVEEVDRYEGRLGGRRAFAAITIRHCVDTTIRRCVIITASLPDVVVASTSMRGAAGTRLAYGSLGAILASGIAEVGTGIVLDGILVQTRIEDNVFLGGTAIKAAATVTKLAAAEAGFPAEEGTLSSVGTSQTASYAALVGLSIEDNAMACVTSGIDLQGYAIHLADTQLTRNTILGCARTAIVATGIVPGGARLAAGESAAGLAGALVRSRLDIRGNVIQALGNGIVIGTDEARVVDNDVGSIPIGEERITALLREFDGYEPDLVATRGGAGIMIVDGLAPGAIDNCQVMGNRLTGVRGHAIEIKGRIASGMIKHNIVNSPGRGGIVMDLAAEAETLTVENNQVLDVAPRANTQGSILTGIQLVNVADGEIASNTVVGIGALAANVGLRAGIRVVSPAQGSVRIVGNTVSEVGPHAGDVGTAFLGEAVGIDVSGPFDRADVVDNSVRRSRSGDADDLRSRWIAVRIAGVARIKDIRFDEEIEIADVSIYDTVTRAEGLTADALSVEEVATAEAAEGAAGAAATEGVRSRMYLMTTGEATRDVIILGRTALKLPRGREIAAARGNLLDGYGSGSNLVMDIDGAATATENRCTLQGTGTSVSITAGAIIAASNYVVGPVRTVPMWLAVPEDAPFTVLGNISSGEILVNGSPLASSTQGAPFAALNVSAS